MANKWCLVKSEADKLRKALASGDIDPDSLLNMSDEKRHALFSELVGEENATQINATIESKFLLKDQMTGITNAFRSILDMPSEGKKIAAEKAAVLKVLRANTYLNPDEMDKFISDYVTNKLANKSIGRIKTEVNPEQAAEIMKLANDVTKTQKYIDGFDKLTKAEGDALMKDKTKNENRLKWGRAIIALDNYMTNLKQEANHISLKERLKNPVKAVGSLITTSMDASKAINASMDDSAILNQGFPILANIFTTKIWAKNSLNSLTDMVKTIGGKEVWDEVRADAVSRPNAVSGLYKKEGLAVKVTEEDFPTSLPKKLIDIGKGNKGTNILLKPLQITGATYKATEVAFSAFQLRNRLDTFDKFALMAENIGSKLGDKWKDTTGLGSLVNNLTSRGGLGKAEPIGNLINSPIFSLRKQVAAVNSLFGYQLGAPKTRFTRTMGALSMIQQILVIAAVAAIANALGRIFLGHDVVESDSRSSDFMKIRTGDTVFDLTQGRAGYATLAARIITSQSKSTATGELSDINSGVYGATTSSDLLFDFAKNKTSPALNEILQILDRKDNNGQQVTISNVLGKLYVPLGAQNIIDASKDSNSANLLAIGLADFFGVNSNTYSISNAKSGLIPENTKIDTKSFLDMVAVYAKAVGTDPEDAFNKIFSGEKIIQVSQGGIIVVARQDVEDSQKFKSDWVKVHGGNPDDIKEVKLDHVIPNKLGGVEEPSNWAIVSNTVWSSNTKVENTLIQAVKDGKLTLKEAQALIKQYKNPGVDSDGYATENVNSKVGEDIIKKYK